MFNISIYVGAIMGGFLTALIAGFFLYLPSILIIWGFLPYWRLYRT
jgi:chromate transport protein ChrA